MASVRLGVFVKRDPRPELNEAMPVVEVDREDVAEELAEARVADLLGGEPEVVKRHESGIMIMTRKAVMVHVLPLGMERLVDPLNCIGKVAHGYLYVRKRQSS